MVLYFNKICSGTCLQVVASFTASLNSLAEGMQAGWPSPMIPRLLLPSSPIKIEEKDVLWIENSYMMGAVVALIPAAYLSNKIGRKKTILVSCAVSLLGWIAMTLAPTALVLIIARFICGFGGVNNHIASPLYIAEISLRGRLGSIIFIVGPVGVLLMYSIGPYVPITNTSIAGAIIVLIQLLTFPIMPESPYYLLIEKKEEAARDSLKALRALDNVDEELNDILAAVERVDMSFKPLSDIKKNLKAFLITLVLNTSYGFSGYNVLIMNMETILSNVSATISAAIIAILFAVLAIVSCLVGAISLDHVGREVILIASCFSASIFLTLIGVYFTAKSYGDSVTQFSWIPIVIILCYAIILKGGVGLLPVFLPSEIFHTNLKAVACAFGAGIYNVGIILSVVLYQYLRTSVGMDVPFYIFGVCMLFSGIFCIFVVPETKRKTLREIQNMLKQETIEDRDKLHNSEDRVLYGSFNSGHPADPADHTRGVPSR